MGNSKVRQSRSVQMRAHPPGESSIDRAGLGKWMKKTLDLDGGRSLQLCLPSLPTSSG